MDIDNTGDTICRLYIYMYKIGIPWQGVALVRSGGTVSHVTGTGSLGQVYVLGLAPRLNLLLASNQWRRCSFFKRAQSFGVESPLLNNVFMARNKV